MTAPLASKQAVGIKAELRCCCGYELLCVNCAFFCQSGTLIVSLYGSVFTVTLLESCRLSESDPEIDLFIVLFFSLTFSVFLLLFFF